MDLYVTVCYSYFCRSVSRNMVASTYRTRTLE